MIRITVIGINGYWDTSDSELVILTACLPRKPGMSREDLLKYITAIIKESTQKIIKYSPQSILIVVSRLFDVMCYVAVKVSGFESNFIIGMTGMRIWNYKMLWGSP